ncbi:MAG: carbon-nitrogen hydrolase [Nitrospiraceae bacterium]|jgi:predicted amidohydrolase|nr:carbon-nitrogen hydrolase [Nitrospiraceae bacterium]
MKSSPPLRVTVIQNSPQFGTPEKNRKEVEDLVFSQKDPSAGLIVLPELFATGYQFVSKDEVASLAEPEDGPTFDFLSSLSQKTGAVVVGGLPLWRADGISNGALVVWGERLLASYDKVHLFDRERDFFVEGKSPLPVVATPFGPLGVMICFDWLFPEALRSLALSGATVVAHPANWVLPFGPQGMILRSVENRLFTVTANRVGTEARGGLPSLRYIGESQIVSPKGEILARAESDRPGIITATIRPDDALSKKVAEKSDFFEQRRPELYHPGLSTRERPS